MPYLHWETDASREKMRVVIDDLLQFHRVPLSGETGAPVAEEMSDRIDDYTLKKRKISDLNLGRNGKILMRWSTMFTRRKLAELGELDLDERLLRGYVTHKDRPLHIWRTLDQSYYWALKDTQTRDSDQVVYRATYNAEHQQARLVMVDQLWLWILDGSKRNPLSKILFSFLTLSTELVITSFPRSWGRRPKDASGVYRIIRERLTDRPNLDNVYNMAILMIDQCSRVFFDHTVPRDNQPDVMDMFANAIGEVVSNVTN